MFHQSTQILATQAYTLDALIANNSLTLTLTSKQSQNRMRHAANRYQIILPSLESIPKQILKFFDNFQEVVHHMTYLKNVQVNIQESEQATIKIITKVQKGNEMKQISAQLTLHPIKIELTLEQQLDVIIQHCQTSNTLQNNEIKQMISILTKSVKQMLANNQNNHKCQAVSKLEQLRMLYDQIYGKGLIRNNQDGIGDNSSVGCHHHHHSCKNGQKQNEDWKQEQFVVQVSKYQQQVSSPTNLHANKDNIMMSLTNYTENYNIKLHELTNQLSETNIKISKLASQIQKMDIVRTSLVEEFQRREAIMYDKFKKLFDEMEKYFATAKPSGVVGNQGHKQDIETIPNKIKSIIFQEFEEEEQNISNFQYDHQRKALSKNIIEQPQNNETEPNRPQSSSPRRRKSSHLPFSSWKPIQNKSKTKCVVILDQSMVQIRGNLLITRIHLKKVNMFIGTGFIDSSLRFSSIKQYGNKWIYYRNDKYLWDGQSEYQFQSNGFKVGDIVELTMNMESGEIEWKVSSRTVQKIKWKYFQSAIEWVPFLYMYGLGDEVQILH